MNKNRQKMEGRRNLREIFLFSDKTKPCKLMVCHGRFSNCCKIQFEKRLIIKGSFNDTALPRLFFNVFVAF
jgi:hypothetical protein